MGPQTVRAYIQSESTDVQKVLKPLYKVILKIAPKADQKISWSMPTFYQGGIFAQFAAFQNHASLFVNPATIEKFQKDLSKFKTTRAGIHFPYGQAVPTGLVNKIVKHSFKLTQDRDAARNKKKAAAKEK